jgi:hypothetical protein
MNTRDYTNVFFRIIAPYAPVTIHSTLRGVGGDALLKSYSITADEHPGYAVQIHNASVDVHDEADDGTQVAVLFAYLNHTGYQGDSVPVKRASITMSKWKRNDEGVWRCVAYEQIPGKPAFFGMG